MLTKTLLPLLLAVSTSLVVAATSFDGPYIQPSISNGAVEWWWAQVIGKAIGDSPPPAFQLLFYQGYPIQEGDRDPTLPEYYITINGFLSNGTAISLTIPSDTGDIATTDGSEEVTGTWGTVGSFHLEPDFSSWTVNFTAEKYGLTGNIVFIPNSAEHHFACNTTKGPYFSGAVESLVSNGTTLSDAEDILYNQLGWATTIPGGTAVVDVVVDGAALQFTGHGYHDANWAPEPLNTIVSTWYFGSGQVGPYDFSYVSATPVSTNSPSPLTLNTGYLTIDGVILQNQCSVEGTKTSDISTITPYGSVEDNGLTIPAGYVLEFVLGDGETYSFNLSSLGQNPDQSIYHRWVGTAVGGNVASEEQLVGSTVFEWLNPGLVVYTP